MAVHDHKFCNTIIDTKENIIKIEYNDKIPCTICGGGVQDVRFYKGEIYKIDNLKKSFPKDIKPNKPIKTDKRTRIEVTLPDVGKVNIAENTQAVLKSENLLEIVKGKIHALIDKLKPQTKFDVNTPTAIVGVRGTEYQIDVVDDGTTTLVALTVK